MAWGVLHCPQWQRFYPKATDNVGVNGFDEAVEGYRWDEVPEAS